MSTGTEGGAARRVASWGSREFHYVIRFAAGRRTLSITVHPDLRVTVVAPGGHAIDAVAARVGRRAKWIAKQLREYERWHPLPTPRRYVSGESHLYLGRQYRLRVERGPEGVAMVPGRIVVRAAPLPDPKYVENALTSWYRERAGRVFEWRLDKLRSRAPRLVGPSNGFRIRRMSQRWGSCSAAGTLTLHPDLVKAPVSCIDYVLVHELCHRRVPNHSPKFYRLLASQMPDWERRRERLNRVRG